MTYVCTVLEDTEKVFILWILEWVTGFGQILSGLEKRNDSGTYSHQQYGHSTRIHILVRVNTRPWTVLSVSWTRNPVPIQLQVEKSSRDRLSSVFDPRPELLHNVTGYTRHGPVFSYQCSGFTTRVSIQCYGRHPSRNHPLSVVNPRSGSLYIFISDLRRGSILSSQYRGFNTRVSIQCV